MNPKIKKYKFAEVKNIMECEYPIDTEVTDTKMSALGLACSLNDSPDLKPDKIDKSFRECNVDLMDLILSQGPNINHVDKFDRTPLHMAAQSGNVTAT